jgi:hypothetical protein
MNTYKVLKFTGGFMVFEALLSVALIAVLFYPTLELVLYFRSILNNERVSGVEDRQSFFEEKEGSKKCDEFLYALQGQYSTSNINTSYDRDVLKETDLNLADFVDVSAYSGSVLGIGTTSAITKIRAMNGYIFLALNSASSSDPDILSTSLQDIIENPLNMVTSKINTGPGLADIVLVKNTIFAADTSVTNTIQKIVHKEDGLSLLSKFYIPKLSDTFIAVAKSTEIFGKYVLVGLEKNIGPEIYFYNQETGQVIASIETGYGITSMKVRGNRLFVLGPTDPELEVFEIQNTPESTTLEIQKTTPYDAPGYSGNGRSVAFFGDDLIFGRSRGGEELNILSIFRIDPGNDLGTTAPVLSKSLKVGASIDSIIAASTSVFQVTSDKDKEFQLIAHGIDKQGAPHIAGYIDLPARANDFMCIGDAVLVGSLDPLYALVVIKIKKLI